ncbi:methylaspartate mutase subunit S [Leisingera daeponensis]|uniref:Glutamate mutase sigma subunit n=1 Tax=Leisingera daeponensis TaxID=405746 RepID=A0ABS7NIQ0_9RHOB|nr:methylaspartate mutase subunit S [Leisingera daeponensis]MBY6141083.1 methylaspartate mutase subunit S [Leisingera daeponensis]
MEQGYKVILGVIGSDCHVVGNRILDRALSDAGIKVVNLGVMVSQEEFVTAAVGEGADAILVSSIYGHGEIDCAGMRERCEERGAGDIVLYAGGNLVIGKKDWKEVEALFLDMGYDRVFRPSVNLAEMIAGLRRDIDLRRVPQLGHNSAAFDTGAPFLDAR